MSTAAHIVAMAGMHEPTLLILTALVVAGLFAARSGVTPVLPACRARSRDPE
jgi:hypothetical protein